MKGPAGVLTMAHPFTRHPAAVAVTGATDHPAWRHFEAHTEQLGESKSPFADRALSPAPFAGLNDLMNEELCASINSLGFRFYP